jgi:cell fate regulator YaaT (PSP1 superfamily)
MIAPGPTSSFLVRHGVMRSLGEYTPSPGVTTQRGDTVILRTDRGTEGGEVLCPASPQAIAAIPEPTHGDILRVATPEDRNKLRDIRDSRNADHATGTQLIEQHHLPMQLVDIERIFGGERMVFYFISESRVDFRELVKSLAREFHTRIELRQIGVRDEAKLLADYGDCGKPVCCNTHMIVMPPVSMRMAKLQKSTLDPTKISGRCGRLKCCLRFEQDVYEEHQKEMPPIGSRVVTNKGQGRVLHHEILARRLLVEFEDGRRLPVTLAEVLTRL